MIDRVSFLCKFYYNIILEKFLDFLNKISTYRAMLDHILTGNNKIHEFGGMLSRCYHIQIQEITVPELL